MVLWSTLQDSLNWIMSKFWDFQKSESWPWARSFFRRDWCLLRGTLEKKGSMRGQFCFHPLLPCISAEPDYSKTQEGTFKTRVRPGAAPSRSGALGI